MLDVVGTVIGLVYLWLEYKASIWLWLAGVVMPIINGWLYYERGIYADCAIQVYYVLAAVYGYLAWKRTAGNAAASSDTQGIRHVSWRPALGILAAIMFIWGMLYWLLTNFTDSTVSVLDSFTTALCIVAMWMLAQKYIEQWLVWFVVDLLTVGLYFYKGIPFHGALYGFYTIMAIVGYRRWCQLAKAQQR